MEAIKSKTAVEFRKPRDFNIVSNMYKENHDEKATQDKYNTES